MGEISWDWPSRSWLFVLKLEEIGPKAKGEVQNNPPIFEPKVGKSRDIPIIFIGDCWDCPWLSPISLKNMKVEMTDPNLSRPDFCRDTIPSRHLPHGWCILRSLWFGFTKIVTSAGGRSHKESLAFWHPIIKLVLAADPLSPGILGSRFSPHTS